MPGIPLLGGMAANNQAEFVESVPLNLEPVAIDNKISTGQFRAPAGLVPHSVGPGDDRGAIVWNGRHLRVMGSSLIEIGVGVIGDVGGAGPVALDYGFDRLSIASGQKLFYLDANGLAQVTDPDLGRVNDALWVDGYFMTTDGSYVVVTQLSDPTQVDPLKYGSAEEDPDMITGLIKVRGEVYVTGRHTIEVLQNTGGNGFPFSVVDGATIPYGCVGPAAKCRFAESFAFVGSARNEALGVYVAGSGTAVKISSRALDRALQSVSDPASIEMEAWSFLDERRLLVHLPRETWVYLDGASRKLQQPIWYRRTNCPRHAIELNGKWFAAIEDQLGTLSNDVSTILGDPVEWRFDTPFAHADGASYILGEIELVGLPGRMPFGEEATAFFSYSVDGQTYSRERMIRLGKAGERRRRMIWRPNCRVPHYATFRFRGFDESMPGFTKIEADVEPLE